MRLIDADTLKEAIMGKYLPVVAEELNRFIDNAPTVPQVTICCENASKEEIENFKQELENVLKRPQGEQIAWEQGYECGKNESRPQGEWITIADVMSVFDDFMKGDVDENDTETFLLMLKDKAEQT